MSDPPVEVTALQLAAVLGVSRVFVARLCQRGRVAGARIVPSGRTRRWVIPWPATISPGRRGRAVDWAARIEGGSRA